MYKFIKITSKVIDILIKVILFIPSCIYYLFYKCAEKYRKWKNKKGYSKRYINLLIKFCDEYQKDHAGSLFVIKESFYPEYQNFISYSDFISVRPYWVKKRVSEVYYSNPRVFKEQILEYYKSRILSPEELKREFTDEQGNVSFWYSNLEGKRVVKF